VSIPIKKAVTSPNVPPPPPIVVSEDEKKKKKKSKPKATLKRKGTLYIYKQVKKKKKGNKILRCSSFGFR
jgi:hypothetical protein